MSEQTIKCPNCKKEIPLTETLTHQIQEKVRNELQLELEKKEQAFKERENELLVKTKEVEISQKKIKIEIATQVEAEKKKLAEEAKLKAEEKVSVKLKDLQEQIKEKSEKIEEAQKKELELMKKQREVEEREKSFELEMTRKIEGERKSIFEEAGKKATEEQKYVIAQLNKKLADVTKAKDELTRKLEQGSQQTQGEVLELELEDILKAQFPSDEILPVPKGIKGADIIQKVIDRSGRICGQIVWESKKTKTWTEGWLQKLKDDQRIVKADLAVIVSFALPEDIKGFGLKDGVFVCDLKLVINLAYLLRYNLMNLAESNRALVGSNEKTKMVYAYVNSNEFKQRIQSIAESFISMKDDLDKEKRAFQGIWSKREKQIQRVLDNTFGVYGDLKGLTGGSIQEIKMLELPEEDDS